MKKKLPIVFHQVYHVPHKMLKYGAVIANYFKLYKQKGLLSLTHTHTSLVGLTTPIFDIFDL